MDAAIAEMGSCGHDAEHARNTSVLRGDVDAMRAIFDGHHDAMPAVDDMDTARTEEALHQEHVTSKLGAWSEHHYTMTEHAKNCVCGGMMGR